MVGEIFMLFNTIDCELDKGAVQPTRAHKTDAGLDFCSMDEQIVVPAGGSAVFNTGVHIEIPFGYAGFIKSKSGLNVKYNLIADGVIDTGYTGAIVVKLYNLGEHDHIVNYGDKIAQLVLVNIAAPKLILTKLNKDTERGDNGFGSTGN